MAKLKEMKGCSGVAILLAIFLAQVLISCTDMSPNPRSEEVLLALNRSLSWLDAHPPDPARASIGEVALDAWPWSLYSRLHPDPDIRARCAAEARARMQGIEPRVEPTLVSLSYWAVLLRNYESQSMDITVYREALSRVNIEAILEAGNPTTTLWITELLRYSGIPIESSVDETYLATSAAAGADRFEPTVRGAYALYHEIAPASDLGREAIRSFTSDQVKFARRVLPALLEVSRNAGDTDAVAEVLITTAILAEREQGYYGKGIEWLLAQQREDGTYRDARTTRENMPPTHFRHGILVVSWALLESLQ